MFVHLLLLRLDISFRVDRIKRPRPAPVPCCLNSTILIDDAVFLLGISGPGDARISFIKGLLLPFGSLPDDVFYLSSSSRPLAMVANTGSSTLYAPPRRTPMLTYNRQSQDNTKGHDTKQTSLDSQDIVPTNSLRPCPQQWKATEFNGRQHLQ